MEALPHFERDNYSVLYKELSIANRVFLAAL
jgi:hypothetical protein